MSLDIFDKYLQNEETNINDDKKEEKETHKLKEEGPMQLSYSIQDVINQIKVECKNFLFSEFKLIMIYSAIFCVFFYFAGKPTIAIFFILSFLIGIVISLVCVYYATTIAVTNCEIVLNQSR